MIQTDQKRFLKLSLEQKNTTYQLTEQSDSTGKFSVVLHLRSENGGWGKGGSGRKSVSKKIVSAIRASVGSKNKGGARAPWAPNLDPPLNASPFFLRNG